MTKAEALDEAIRVAGGQTKLAQLLADFLRSESQAAEEVKVSQAHVHYWVKTGEVPAEYARAIEKVTNRAVLRTELRPDIYPPEEFALIVESAEELQQFFRTLQERPQS